MGTLGTPRSFTVKNLSYTIRQATEADAGALAALRIQADSETEFLAREPGEDPRSPEAFKELIQADAASPNSLMLVAETADGTLAGYARCAGSHLRRMAHQTGLGIMVLQAYWAYGMGGNLITALADWARAAGLHKITLEVVAHNTRAIALYKRLGFVEEGLLRDNIRLADGRYYDTPLMALMLEE